MYEDDKNTQSTRATCLQEEEHTLEVHISRLNKLCRLCGGKSSTKAILEKGQGISLCHRFKERILKCYKIDVTHDVESKHSSTMCHTCRGRCTRNMRTTSETILQKAAHLVKMANHIWVGYDPLVSSNECASCKHLMMQYSFPRLIKKNSKEDSTSAVFTLSNKSTPEVQCLKPSKKLDTCDNPEESAER